ncbi:MAG TPA: hypothetical protein VHX20_06380 [Terracidiphilus sp.]|nr:hypothetical protein [Terracidiphilus sp.]
MPEEVYVQEHWIAVAAAVIGIAGTAALSFDLLKSKSVEESIKDFKHLQDELDIASQELTFRMNEGLSTMAAFLGGYLSFLEIEAEVKEETAQGKSLVEGTDPEMDKIRRYIYGHSEVSLRHNAVAKFLEARQKLASPEQTQKALDLVADIRRRVELQFVQELTYSQRLKRVAIAGVLLVGLGAIAQLVDLLLT